MSRIRLCAFGFIMSCLIAAVLVSCTGGNADRPSGHGAVCTEAVAKAAVLKLDGGIRALAITPDGETLLALTQDKLLSIEADRLVVEKAISLANGQPGETASFYWSRKNLVCSPSGRYAIVDNCVIDVRRMEAVAMLQIDGVLDKGQPDPFPLAVSPDEQLVLIYLRSFHDRIFDRVCVYQLDTGKLVQNWGTAGEVQTAFFGPESEVLLLHRNGSVTVLTTEGTAARTLNAIVPTVPLHSTVSMIHGGGGEPSRLVLAGQQGEDHVVAVFSLPNVGLMEQWTREGPSPVAVTQSAICASFDMKEGGRCGCGKHPMFHPLLLLRDLATGVVSELAVQQIPVHAVLAPDGQSLFASDHDGVIQLSFPSTTGKD